MSRRPLLILVSCAALATAVPAGADEAAARMNLASATLRNLTQALKEYESDWGLFPPSAPDHGSRALLAHLDGDTSNGGPRKMYYEFGPRMVRDGRPIDPWGREYRYRELYSRRLKAARRVVREGHLVMAESQVNIHRFDLWSQGPDPATHTDDLTNDPDSPAMRRPPPTEAHRRVHNMRQLKQLALGLHLYRDSKGRGTRWPPLERLLTELFTSGAVTEPQLFVCPGTGLQPNAEALRNHETWALSYEWTPYPICRTTGASTRPVAWDKPGNFKGQRCVMFLDGHVEAVKEADFVQLMVRLRAQAAEDRQAGRASLHMPAK